MSAPPPVYLDHHSTTPVDTRVIDAMVEALRENYGNPSSRHEVGARADRAVQESRTAVAVLIGSRPEDIFFTSGATESNNLVIRGAAARRGDRTKFVTSAIEHPSVLEPAQELSAGGLVIKEAQPRPDGLVTQDALQPLIDDEVFLVSIMLANNEIGTINPISSLVGMTHRVGALFHTDATQAVGNIPVNVASLGVDLLSFSAHKLYGPKGIGALYAPRKVRQRISPQILGGGHERGVRSGTLNVPGIVGFGVAAEIAIREINAAEKHVAGLRNLLLALLRETISDVQVNGSVDSRLPGNLNVFLPGVDAEALVLRLKHVAAFSTGAACSSTKVAPSHVLIALFSDPVRAYSSIRFGIGRGNTVDQVRAVAAAVAEEASFLRGIAVGS